IKKWGTELDRENRDLRREVDRIEVFTNHRLFQNDVILIDTPGFNGILAHHEEIARQAMNQSHVALWIQEAKQLGGNAQEWIFLNQSLEPVFNRFVTVINKWDEVYKESEKQNKEVEEHIHDCLEAVRKNFRDTCRLPKDQIDMLVSDRNLMGVSAEWALSKDPLEREKSNIQKLADRIQEICVSGEGHREILAAPMKKLLEIQEKLKTDIQSELEELEASRGMENLISERNKVDFEIRQLEQDKKEVENESRHEHHESARQYAKQVQEMLVNPLRKLKSELESYLTEDYIRHQMEKGVKNITLPDGVREQYEFVTQNVLRQWHSCRDDLLKTLSDLRAAFAGQMSHISQRLSESFKQTRFTLPEFNVNLTPDLSGIETYQSEMIRLETEKRDMESQLTETDMEIRRQDVDKDWLAARKKDAEQRLQMIRMQISSLGSQPSPMKIMEEKTKKGIWKDTPYTEERVDDSNVRNWENGKRQIEEKERNQEKELERILHEEYEKRGQQVSREFAKQKLEKELQKRKRELDKLQQKIREESSQKVSDILRRMKQASLHHVDAMILALEKNVSQSIEKLFTDQLHELLRCVQEQYADRLETRKKQLESVLYRIQEGQVSVEKRKQELQTLANQVAELMTDTHDLNRRILKTV
ncbi:MAG: dynamin family protein, partial [Desulfococcaceae bacterium]|nr:dynamin family protein [Desulfococcaceae bacterium]